jgi:hypothetical protein
MVVNHGDINFDNYKKWLKTKFIPNFLPYNVLAIDNASNQNVQLHLAPSSASSKQETDLLPTINLYFTEKMCKPEF